jgi:hypothetical protein
MRVNSLLSIKKEWLTSDSIAPDGKGFERHRGVAASDLRFACGKTRGLTYSLSSLPRLGRGFESRSPLSYTATAYEPRGILSSVKTHGGRKLAVSDDQAWRRYEDTARHILNTVADMANWGRHYTLVGGERRSQIDARHANHRQVGGGGYDGGKYESDRDDGQQIGRTHVAHHGAQYA